MEGGSLPWKTQSIVNNSPDIESFSKSLPPPPSGFYWEKKPDDSWELLKFQDDAPNNNLKTTVDNPSIIEHTVMPNDTLQGICLRYHTTPVELRRVNLFSGNNIQFIKTLKIPLAPGVQFESQLDGPDVIIRRFSNMTNEGVAESRIYLEESGWDLEKAYTAWKVDEKWEGQHFLSKVQEAINSNSTVCPEDIELPPPRSSSRANSEPAAVDDHAIEMLSLYASEQTLQQPLLS